MPVGATHLLFADICESAFIAIAEGRTAGHGFEYASPGFANQIALPSELRVQ
jgi:hypothetical protein